MTASDRSLALGALTEPATHEQTGCLHVHDQSRTHVAQAYYNDGRLYAVHVQGFRPAIADRMLTAGLLDQTLHDQVIAAVGGDPRKEDIGHLAVRRGMITQETLDAIHREILLSAIGAITTWHGPKTRFRKGVVTDLYTVPAVPVTAVLHAVERRSAHWDMIWREMNPGCPPHEATPRRTEQQFPVALDLSPDARTLLAQIDGNRTVDDLAAGCGLTRFETGHLLHTLVTAGLACLEPAQTPTYATPAAPPTATAVVPPAPVTPPLAVTAVHAPVTVSSNDAPAHVTAAPKVAPVRRTTNTTAPVAPAPVPAPALPNPAPQAAPSSPPPQPLTPPATSEAEPVPAPQEDPTTPTSPDLVAARTEFAAAQAFLTRAEQRAREAELDHTRIAAVASDAQHAARQAAHAVDVARAEELRANEAIAHAQAALDKAHELTTASQRAARDLADRATATSADADRARQRVHETATALTAAREAVDGARVALAHAQNTH